MSAPEGPAAPALEGYGARSRIRGALILMPEGMAKVGTLLLEDPSLPLRLSITELAKRAGTSPATVTRFCRAIGYTGYLALRVGAAAEQGRSSAHETWDSDIGRAFHPDDTATEMMRTLVNAHTVALMSTSERLDPALVGRVADAVAQSTHVDIYGIGGSAGIAVELQARLYRIGINAHAWSEVHVGLTSAVLLGDSSVAIAFSNTGRTEETIEMLALAKSSGAYAVAVTSDPASPMAQVADAHLTSHAPGEYLQPDDLSAKHAQLFVIDLLYLLVAQRDFSRTTSLLAASAAGRRAASPSASLGVPATDRALAEGNRHSMSALLADFSTEVRRRLDDLDQEVRAGGLDPAIDLIVSSLQRGGVLQAFGTGHSQAFAMEIAGRAGGLIPTHAIVLRDVVLRGSRDVSLLQGATLERDESVVDELYGLYTFEPADVFLIASNSGVNGSIVGLAERAKADGHPVIAVTSLEHTNAVTPKHSSGKRLSEVADIVIENRAPFGDTTIGLGDGLSAGAVSSITAAYIAQLLTLGAAQRLRDAGEVPPLYISANIPGGDAHNDALKARYGERIAGLA